ncbi:MAG: hypothetical protein LIO74_11980 [Ruminococcus sp.]|nr:hypothetical protein [Ruminococcus sp.]
MIKLINLSTPIGCTESQLLQAIAKRLKISKIAIIHIQPIKKSIDARKKPNIFVVWTFLLKLKQEEVIYKRYKNDHDVERYKPHFYNIPKLSLKEFGSRPVVIGFGPAEMFAAYLLAKVRLRPIVLERGKCVEQRQKDVASFWKTGQLNPSSNVQFGEGGAGTFSDGKLTTRIKDFRIQFILETFISCGAPKEILYLAKPHIGTDRLVQVVKTMREKIQAFGGEIHFQACMKRLQQANRKLIGVIYEQDGQLYHIETEQCILAIGHSARDVFSTLYQDKILLEQKNFSIDVQIEHKQATINQAMYDRDAAPPDLPVADYKLAVHLPNRHNLYTFCMCPGGEVIAASSELNRLAINGMSRYARNGINANNALLVGITSNELHDTHPLAGMYFQQKLEEAAFHAGGSNYFAPVCTVGDFLNHRMSKSLGDVKPTYRPGVTIAAPESYLPNFVVDTLCLGIPTMARKIQGFDSPDAILTGIESRSSSPIRILRNEFCESISLAGLYPYGEGAGYAGGIISAAVDDLRCAEQIVKKFTKNHS